MSGRIVLLLSSPRVAPGLLGWPAWELLHDDRARVYVGSPDHPQLPALRAAGVSVDLLAGERDRRPDPDRIAEHLLAVAGRGELVVWLSGPEGDPGLGEALGSRLLGGDRRGPQLEILPGSYDLPGARLIELVQVMDRLRRECPWVQRQTHRSLVRYLVEESYETVEALEAGDRVHLREELGDLLFQVVFHARLAEEYGADESSEDAEDVESAADGERAEEAGEAWSIDEVAADLTEKLIRRNPHVFGPDASGGSAGLSPDEIENVWDQLKSEEKRRDSVFEGLPPGLPALAMADKMLQRAERAGLEPPDTGEPESAESEASIGDRLLAVVRQARSAGIDPEQALRDALRRRFSARE